MKIEKSHLLIGAVVLAAGVILYKRSKRQDEESEALEDAVIDAEIEAEAQETSNFSNAEGMPKGYSTDCFRSSQGDTCCYDKSKRNIQCDGVYTEVKDASRATHPVDRVVGMISRRNTSRPTMRRASTSRAMSRPDRPSAR